MEISEISHEFKREKLHIDLKDLLLHIDLKDLLKIPTEYVMNSNVKIAYRPKGSIKDCDCSSFRSGV